ncbi:hypothetical protein TL16_g07183 [Triparma laevis f. inornata]|uniref:Uncharacterized protein n=1 Tax=Triparma laevis f. inornata TaxID=1714386 RepID=A0A9W7EFC0_9STRA|nr:hypothetical protein TL16_g07183 [Triparma laevis f. inornata]
MNIRVFEEMQAAERCRLWKWACRMEIKKIYLKKINVLQEEINRAITAAGESNDALSSTGSGGTTHLSKVITKLQAVNGEKIAGHHQRLGKMYFEDEDWTNCEHNLKACIKFWPKKVSNITLLSECYTSMFKSTSNFSYLENAKQTLGLVLSRMRITPFTISQFPKSIYALARVYETYGSFEGALEMYGRILEMFPKYNKYQKVLYRCCVVMLHLSNLDNAKVSDLLSKSVEMMKYILENFNIDLSNLDKSDCCLLYARILQAQDRNYNGSSGNVQLINATMSELFYIRKAKKLTGRLTSHVLYFKQPIVWSTMAQEYASQDEPTLSVNMYDECIQLMKKSSKPSLSTEFLLDIATQYAKFQENETAVEYAQGAWMENRFDPRARQLLAGWSEDFKWYFQTQEAGAKRMQRKWKTRIWSRTYYWRYHKICVDRWEQKLKRRHFDIRTREKLAYFAKNKWRGLFIYEEAMATRIQKFYRAVQMKWLWMSGKRAKHKTELAGVYKRWRRHPYDLELRAQCIVAAAHKFTPATHNIKKLPERFENENRAALLLQRTARVWHAKAIIRDLMEKRRVHREKLQKEKAWMIQMEARRYNARRELKRRWLEYDERWEAAIFLQNYWRTSQQTMAFVMKALKKKKQREDIVARIEATNRMIATWRMIMTWRLVRIVWKNAATKIEKVVRGGADRRHVRRLRYMYAVRIQRAWHCKVENDYLKILLQRLKTEQERKPPEVTLWVNRRINAAKKGANSVPGEGEYRYSNPGMVKSSKDFAKVLHQKRIVFDGSFCRGLQSCDFDSADCVMLGNVMSNPDCRIEDLVLSRATSMKSKGLNALAEALVFNKSVTTLGLVDCDVGYENGLDRLFDVMTTKNFNVNSLILDRGGKKFADEGGLRSARLIEDFFLLQFGNLVTLSLNSNCITDVSGVEIGRAIGKNHNLQTLLLADNQISDDGAFEIGNSLQGNKTLQRLDLSKNYVQNRGGVRIAEVLRDDNRTIRYLNLSYNLISDKVVPLFREVIKTNRRLDNFLFAGNQFRTKFLNSLQAVWDKKMEKIEQKKEELEGDNSYLKTYESVRRRIKERSRNKNLLSPKSFKKTQREGIESSNPKAAVRVADWLSPGGGGWKGDYKTKLQPLPFYRGEGVPKEDEVRELFSETMGELAVKERNRNKAKRASRLVRQPEIGENKMKVTV